MTALALLADAAATYPQASSALAAFVGGIAGGFVKVTLAGRQLRGIAENRVRKHEAEHHRPRPAAPLILPAR